MIFKISRKNWKHEYLMQTSIMEMNDKNIPLQENHLFMVLTPDNVQIVALGGKCFVKLRRVAEMVKLKYKQSSNSVWEVEETGHLIFTSRNGHLLFIALPWLFCLRWSSARLIKCLKPIFEGQPCKGLQAKATPDCRLDAGWFPEHLAGCAVLIMLHITG